MGPKARRWLLILLSMSSVLFVSIILNSHHTFSDRSFWGTPTLKNGHANCAVHVLSQDLAQVASALYSNHSSKRTPAQSRSGRTAQQVKVLYTRRCLGRALAVCMYPDRQPEPLRQISFRTGDQTLRLQGASGLILPYSPALRLSHTCL